MIAMISEKGTIGLTMNQSDMPFTEEGISPDLIINPHCIPKRMTVGQLVECLVGKVAALKGIEADGTPFNEIDIEKVKDELENLGYERNATEYVYCGLTGQRLKIPIFIGPTYYQRLKHLVMDKMHCIPVESSEILTLNGWKKYGEFTTNDLVATLIDDKLVYEKPTDIYYYPQFNDKMYHISNSSINLDVTMEHRMWVSKISTDQHQSTHYDFQFAKDIVGKHLRYKKDADWTQPDYQIQLPNFIHDNDHAFQIFEPNMNSWIVFFAICFTCRLYGNINNTIQINVDKQQIKDVLCSALETLGFKYTIHNQILTISNSQLEKYMQVYHVQNSDKYLPDWCFKLSKIQSQLLIDSLLLTNDDYCQSSSTFCYLTTSTKFADQFQQLCLHAGYASDKLKHIELKLDDDTKLNNIQSWRLGVVKTNTNPTVNNPHNQTLDSQEEYIYNYKGPVFCIQVTSGVFMMRSNGKTCWTGNSRATGPINMLTRQACEGRSKDGGLKCGEFHFATKSTDYNPVLVH